MTITRAQLEEKAPDIKRVFEQHHIEHKDVLFFGVDETCPSPLTAKNALDILVLQPVDLPKQLALRKEVNTIFNIDFVNALYIVAVHTEETLKQYHADNNGQLFNTIKKTAIPLLSLKNNAEPKSPGFAGKYAKASSSTRSFP